MLNRKFVGLLCCCVLLLVALPAGGSSQSDNILTYTFLFDEPAITFNQNGFVSVEADDLPNTMRQGAFSLPVKPVSLVIPSGYELDHIELKVDDNVVIAEDVSLKRVANICRLTQDSLESNDEMMSQVPYRFEFVGLQHMRGAQIAFINLYPVQYDEKNILSYYPEMSIELSLRQNVKQSNPLLLNSDIQKISDFVDNPEILSSYQTQSLEDKDAISYVIITTEELLSDAQESFDEFLAARQASELDATIVTVESIVQNPDYWVDGLWGDANEDNPFYGGPLNGETSIFNDTQAKIRNFIRGAYSIWSTRYVLLVGDADAVEGGDNLVPVRGLFATEEGLPLGDPLDFEQDDIPSDIYYACLDGNFNYDGDIHFGENSSYNNLSDIDEADLLSEVSVGRWPADSATEVQNIVEKTLYYETTQNPYLSKILFVGEYLGFPGVSAYGGNYMDTLIPIIPDSFIVETLYEREWNWNKHDLLSLLNDATPHLINHLGHGNENYALKMYNSDIMQLENEDPFFIYSQTCLAGAFDNYKPWQGFVEEDSAAEHFTVGQAEGAFAVVMNSRFGLGSEDDLLAPSHVMHDSFLQGLFAGGYTHLGDANHYAKEDHAWHIDDNGIRWVFYETNLIGDPAVEMRGPIDIDVNISAQWFKPQSGDVVVLDKALFNLGLSKSLIFGPVSLEVEASTDPAGFFFSIEFYLDDELLDVVYDEPYSCPVFGNLFGPHTFKAVVKSSTGESEELILPAWLFILAEE